MNVLRGTEPQARLLATLALCTLLSALGTSSANVALPTLAQAFDTSFQQVQWVVLAYLLAMTALIVSVGRLGDLFGRRRLLLAGIVVFMSASAIAAVAPALWLLVAARAAQGVGAAAMIVLAMALADEAAPKARTGSTMGLLGTMSAIGTALGPSLAGVLISAFGWRAIFLVNLPLGLVGFLLARRSLPAGQAAPPTARLSFDAAGMVLLAVTLAAYLLAMTARNGFGADNLGFLVAAGLAAVLFLRTEARVASPLVRPDMFRNPAISAGFVMSALVAAVVMATLVVGPFYLSRTLGLAPAALGAIMSVGPIVAALGGVPSGRLVDRLGTHVATTSGLLAMAAGSAALALAPAALGVWGYVAPLTALTAGYALFQAANNTAFMNGSSPAERGVVAGLLNLSRNLGLITGASAMGTVFALASGSVDVAAAHPDQVAAGMHGTFAVAAGLIAVALAIALARGRHAVRLPA